MNKRNMLALLQGGTFIQLACNSGLIAVQRHKDLKNLYNTYENYDHFLWLIYRIEPDRRKFVSLYYDIIKAHDIIVSKECRSLIERYINIGKYRYSGENDEYKESVYKLYSKDSVHIYDIHNIIIGCRFQITDCNPMFKSDITMSIIRKHYSYRRMQFLLNKMV